MLKKRLDKPNPIRAGGTPKTLGACSAAKAYGITIRFGEIVSRRCEPAMAAAAAVTGPGFGSKHPG